MSAVAKRLATATATLLCLIACEQDDDAQDGAPSRGSYFEGIAEAGRPNVASSGPPATGMDAAVTDAAAPAGGDGATTFDSGSSQPTPDASAPDAGIAGDVVRGRYLVHHVAACVECHTPRDLIGRVDNTKLLSGVECFRDDSQAHDKSGCLHTGNLTNHETGLKNRSDLEIKAMFMEGMRPNGKALHPAMPYWVFGNMSEADASSIVAYLRTVTGISHMIPPSQPPFRDVAAPAARWASADLPSPRPDYQNQAAALRGRYLATSVASCLDCHTPRKADGSADTTRAFRGGLNYERADLGLPAGLFADVIATANLTPHADGLAGWSVNDIVSALKDGKDKEGKSLCPPMPSGMGAFGGLTTQDAEDIAHYLLSLPPAAGKVTDVCTAPF